MEAMSLNVPVILASGSSDRKYVLNKYLLNSFSCMLTGVEKSLFRSNNAQNLATTLAYAKAKAVMDSVNSDRLQLVISSELVVVCFEKIYGKPLVDGKPNLFLARTYLESCFAKGVMFCGAMCVGNSETHKIQIESYVVSVKFHEGAIGHIDEILKDESIFSAAAGLVVHPDSHAGQIIRSLMIFGQNYTFEALMGIDWNVLSIMIKKIIES